MKILGFVIFLLLHVGSIAQTGEGQKYVLQVWQKFQSSDDNGIRDVLNFRKSIEKELKTRFPLERGAFVENACQALITAGRLYRVGTGIKVNPVDVKKLLAGISISSAEFLSCKDWKRMLEHYYAIRELRAGTGVSNAWGKMFFNISVPTVGNECDYRRYRYVLEECCSEVMLEYLECLKQVFRYNGFTRGLEELRPYLEKYLPESSLKQELRELYNTYGHLKEGAVAPSFSLKNYKGEIYQLEDFRGKVLVIDVWATWCGGCIKKLPDFLAMREKYKNRDDIEFITISIDNADVFNTWKYATARYGLLDMKNLIASKGECNFSECYNITGVPRYFVIDREGKIVSVYAPAPGNEFGNLIDLALECGQNTVTRVKDVWNCDTIRNWEKFSFSEEQKSTIVESFRKRCFKIFANYFFANKEKPTKPDYRTLIEILQTSSFPFPKEQLGLLKMWELYKQKDFLGIQEELLSLLPGMVGITRVQEVSMLHFLLGELLERMNLEQCLKFENELDKLAKENQQRLGALSSFRTDVEGRKILLEWEKNN